MKITKIDIENFRLLKDFSIDLEKDLSLVIGKNNTGKTSLLSILDKFLNEKIKFKYDDFNISFKAQFEASIMSKELDSSFPNKGIKLKIFIQYDESDDLSNVSRILMDLDPDKNMIVLGFEYTIDETDFINLRRDYSHFTISENMKSRKNEKYTPKQLNYYLKENLDKYFNIHKYSFGYNLKKGTVNEYEVNESEWISLSEGINIKDILNFKFISARRDVTNKDRENTLSKQTSSLYKRQEDSNEKIEATDDFKDKLSETDETLSNIYKDLFKDVIGKVKDFGGIKLNDSDIAIISTLEHRELLEGNTTVVYAHDNHQLPEHYNGLGYMNLISMIFEIEILVQEFKRDKDRKPADINLLIIEEPEAHTHPQMQYVFIKNIKKLLSEGIRRKDGINRNLQYIITTHSSHIVADSDFDDIKYLRLEDKNNVKAKNLKDLKDKYDNETNQYQFLKQYLTISRAEIFFADKAILIEGDTERILIPTFMRKVDLEEKERWALENKDDNYLPLLSQNVSIIEVGAYSQIFENFIEFLGIKSLVITDIDAIKVIKVDENNKDLWGKCPVHEGTKTSNSAINYFLNGIEWDDLKILTIERRTKKIGHSRICICYQQLENAYHARSFEDAFIHLNKAFIKASRTTFQGIQHASYFDDEGKSPYELAESCIKKKTHFALDILYHSKEDFSNWSIPEYIKNGLLWLKED